MLLNSHNISLHASVLWSHCHAQLCPSKLPACIPLTLMSEYATFIPLLITYSLSHWLVYFPPFRSYPTLSVYLKSTSSMICILTLRGCSGASQDLQRLPFVKRADKRHQTQAVYYGQYHTLYHLKYLMSL